MPGSSAVATSFSTSYQAALANLLGTVPERTDVFNYHLESPTSGTMLADGTAVERHFKANEWEGYAQDAWRIKPNLTMTFGVRYTILETPWETKGQQVIPTIDMHDWYLKREAAAQAGQIYEEHLQFAPSGPYYGKPGYST